MFLSREIDIKLCQNYTKTNICHISFKSCSIKQTIFSKYATNLKTIISHRSLRILGVERYIYKTSICMMFLSREIDIKLCQNYSKTYICKIYVRITRPELPPMTVQYTGHMIQTETRDNDTALPLVGVLVM